MIVRYTDTVDPTPEEGVMLINLYEGHPDVAHFECPDGCGEIVTLPLDAPHRPGFCSSWELEISPENKPSLHPDIHLQMGCESHFVIANGDVLWM